MCVGLVLLDEKLFTCMRTLQSNSVMSADIKIDIIFYLKGHCPFTDFTLYIEHYTAVSLLPPYVLISRPRSSGLNVKSEGSQISPSMLTPEP